MTSGYADADGLKVYYEVHGTGDPLVLLHGSFMTIEGNWAHLPKGQLAFIPGGDHFFPWKRPDLLVPMVTVFLDTE